MADRGAARERPAARPGGAPEGAVAGPRPARTPVSGRLGRAAPSPSPETPAAVAGVLRSPGPGVPLATSVARPIGAALGIETGAVRVHDDARAAAAADLMGARAFAWGGGVFLGSGERPTDLRLMAHEVAHVVQQQGGPAVQLFGARGSDPLEREAQAAAAAVAAGGQARIVGRTAGAQVQGAWIPGFVRRAAGAVASGVRAVAGAAGDLLAAARAKVMGFIREKATVLPGYHLLAFALGRDPVTQQPVPRTATNLVKAVLGLIPGGAALFDNLQQAGVIQRAFDWLSAETAKLGLTWEAFKALLAQVWDSLSLADLASPSAAWERLKALFAPPLTRLVAFARAAGRRLLELVFEGALALGGGAAQRVLDIFRRIGDAFGLIVSDPLGFLRNLLAAVKGGFHRFVANIVDHLKTALFQWLTGAFAGALRLPDRWDLRGIVSVVLQVLGLTYDRMREKLVKLVGEPAVRAVETAFEFLRTVVVGGIAAAWQKLLEFASGLVDTVVGGIRDWVARSVIGAAVTKLVTLFNPVGAIIQGIITIYNTVMFFIERAKQIAALVESIVDSISAIARGSIAAAVSRVETTMARTLPVVIGFMARLIGLGNVTGAVKGIIEKIQGTISDAIDRVVAWIVERARPLFSRAQPGKAEKEPPSRDLRERAGQLVVERAGGAKTDAELQKVVDAVKAELKPQGLTRLEFRAAPDGGEELIAQASEPKSVATKKTATPLPPVKRVVLRARLTFEGSALSAIEAAGGAPIAFSRFQVPRRPRERGQELAGELSAAPAGFVPESQGRFGAVLLEPPTGATRVDVVAWNSGEPVPATNDSHAERFFEGWLARMGLLTKGGPLKAVHIDINLSPCSNCARELPNLTGLGIEGSIAYQEAYQGQSTKKGEVKLLYANSTTTDDLALLAAKGWRCSGATPKLGTLTLTDEVKRDAIKATLSILSRNT